MKLQTSNKTRKEKNEKKMSTLYKLTDSRGQTRNGTQWGPGVLHSGTGEGELCGPGWIHAYEHPLIAVLMNPLHADYTSPRLWEAEGEIAMRDGQLKCVCKTLTTIREIPLPEITAEMRVRFAILSAKDVCACRVWNAWADKWLSGEDRTQAAARAAIAAAAAHVQRPVSARAEAMWRAARAAARAAAWAAARVEVWAAAWAAWAAEASRETGVGTDIFAIAENACSCPGLT